ncbi:WD40-repeat-containing domain protein [Polychytrium aggregatum]|uniref:WD40-repeat-containing domain protein n=1 Tax=Polychytrium aggregatum TaxID=110093 RepID=UPI0022FEF4DE|nr:WD40-repeat-containing domain protein [Polychytrium aggregatum]KAI9208531.1 WD40-repeat-containing domain protein [Polychytrium aggregatum]
MIAPPIDNPSAYMNTPAVPETKRKLDETRLLSRLKKEDALVLSQMWTCFEQLSDLRHVFLSGLVSRCRLTDLSLLSCSLPNLLRFDLVGKLPPEIALHIFQYLDAKSLCHAAQVSKAWKILADDDVIWHRMCEQHIDKKCNKCGWGLPLMDKRRIERAPVITEIQQQQQQAQQHQQQLLEHQQAQQQHQQQAQSAEHPPAQQSQIVPSVSSGSYSDSDLEPPRKRSKILPCDSVATSPSPSPSSSSASPSSSANNAVAQTARVPSTAPVPAESTPVQQSQPRAASPPYRRVIYARPWKDIYAERMIVGRNWRHVNYTTKDLQGHTKGITSLQFDSCKGLLISSSYDTTIRVWDMESGKCLKELTGHTRCVRAIQFDNVKLISGSMDNTIRIWSMKTFECLRVLEGHNNGITCLHFNDRILATGSKEGPIRVWDIKTGKCFFLVGEEEYVNKVQILPNNQLLSCSEDHAVKLWDLTTRQILRRFNGHTAPVQSLQAYIHPSLIRPSHRGDPSASSGGKDSSLDLPKSAKLVTCGLDNTLRTWSLSTGECLNTLFGHTDGVWCVSFDSLRIASGGQDGVIKIWDNESGTLLFDLAGGHNAAVNCIQLSDTTIVSW